MSVNRIDSGLVSTLMKDLDKALKEKGQKREITIFGSGAMMAQGILRPNRHTVDVDLAHPDMDVEFQVISADVGARHKLDMTWLNSAGVIFSRNFPADWEKRRVLIFEGEGLIVHSLGRKDLIATKFNALCGRNEPMDLDDLIDLRVSKPELQFAKDWVLQQKDRSTEFSERVERKALEVLSHGYGRSQ